MGRETRKESKTQRALKTEPRKLNSPDGRESQRLPGRKSE